MLSIRSFHGRISRPFLINSSSFFLHLLHFSTTSPSDELQPHFMVDYLIDSLNFSKQEAISTSTKVRHLKSTKNSQSVIDFLRNYDLSETHIKSIVVSQPRILARDVDKTLDPKFKLLSEIGFSASDLVAIMKNNPTFLNRGLHTSIIPAIRFFRQVIGSNEELVKAIKRSRGTFYGKSFRRNVELFERFGISNKDIKRIMIRSPGMLNLSPQMLEEKLNYLETKFGITRGSTMFSYGLSAICSIDRLILEKKFEMLKSFGWCDSDISTIAKRQPVVFTHSEERLKKGLDFFMVELGYSPSWLAIRGNFLMYSLEKRVKPRYQVFKVLKEKGLIKNELHSVLWFSDVDFLSRVVLHHKEAIPEHLFDSFTKKL